MTRHQKSPTPVKTSPAPKAAAKSKRSPPSTPSPKKTTSLNTTPSPKKKPASTPSPRTKAAKQAAFQAQDDWRGLIGSVNAKKDGFKVRYYFTAGTTQVDRNWVAQAASFYNGRTKRQACPDAATVTAQLPNFVQGYTQNLNANLAPIVTFKAAKHVMAFAAYLAGSRNQHHNIIVRMNLDDSPFLRIV